MRRNTDKMILELQTVSFEQSKSLKEVGFPQHILTEKVYLMEDISDDIIANECDLNFNELRKEGSLVHNGYCYTKYDIDVCTCPTLELVAKWLRNEKGFMITIEPHIVGKYRCQVFNTINGIDSAYPIGDTIYKDIYEEALSAGIDNAIEMLRQNEKKS